EVLRLRDAGGPVVGESAVEADADLISRRHRGDAGDRRHRDVADAAGEVRPAARDACLLAAHRQILAVEARAIEQGEVAARRDVGAAVIEARADRELAVALGAVALPDQEVGAAGGGIIEAAMEAVIDALSAVDAVVAGEAVADEKIAVVEFEGLRILVGDGGGV